MKINNKLLVIAYVIIMLIIIASLIRKPKEISEIENRNLNMIPRMNYIDYLDGIYQQQLENGLSDQILGSGTIRQIFQKNLNFTNKLSNSKIICKNKYVKLGEGEDNFYYKYNCDSRLVYGPIRDIETRKKRMQRILKEYHELEKKYDVYYYYIPTSYTFDFTKNKEIFSLRDMKTPNMKMDYLKYNNYEEFSNYFYKTDHHWNYKGSYQGYLDMVKLLGIEEDYQKPVEVVKFPFYFYGSHARILQFTDYKEKFEVYKFNLPKHTAVVPAYNLGYGGEENYFAGIYNTDTYTEHYAQFYGRDYGEIIFDYNNKNKDNLLILSNSFSNAVNALLASHFNKTFVVDKRHYKEFDLEDYISKNRIDKILFIIDSHKYFKDDTYTFIREG